VLATMAGEPVSPMVQGQPDTSRWLCSLCPYREGWYGTLNFGPGFLDHSSLKYADYRGLDERGAFPAVDGEVRFRNASEQYVDFHGHELGLESRSLELRGGRRGRYQARLAYREIPRYRGFDTATVFSGAGSGHLSLPADWQKSSATAGMSALESSLTPASLKTLRRTLRGGLSLRFAPKWEYDVDFQHETKNGTQPFGAGLFTINTSQFPAPVDFTTDRFDMGLQYSGDLTHFRLGFAGSRFDNGTNSVTWENPFSSGPDNQLLRASLAPDNEFHQFSLQGVFAPVPGMHFSGRAVLGRMRQNEPLLPYSINPAFSDLVLPRTSAGARIDAGTLDIAGKLTARLSSRLDLYASAKFDQRDNHSPVDAYTIVITDFVPGGDRLNRPYSFDREKYDIEALFRAAPSVTVRAGSRHEQYKRSLQSVRKTEERLYWGELNYNRWSTAQVHVKLEHSNRNASPYVQVDNTGLIENPMMRKFHLADRERNRTIMELDLFPDQPWSLNLSWSRAKDEYGDSLLGLRQSKEEIFSMDFGMSLTARISLNAFASREGISSALSGFDTILESSWDALTDDRINAYGLGISGRLSKRVTLGLDWTASESRGKVSVSGAQPFPDLRNRFGNLRGSIAFEISPSWGCNLFVEHENLSTRDWQIDGLGPGGVANVLTLGGVSPHYSITAVRLQASYRY